MEEPADSEDKLKTEQQNKLKQVINSVFAPEAVDRLNNIKLSNPELYNQVVQIIIQNVQSGRIKNRISDEELKSFVAKMLASKKEPSIRFNRK